LIRIISPPPKNPPRFSGCFLFLEILGVGPAVVAKHIPLAPANPGEVRPGFSVDRVDGVRRAAAAVVVSEVLAVFAEFHWFLSKKDATIAKVANAAKT
jgi:hypothetical protein